MRRFLMRFCDYLEKKLYADPTYQELARVLDKTKYKLAEANSEISYLQSIVKQLMNRE